MAVEKLEYVDEKVLHSFAKRLANNEPRLRKIALKKLKGWMEIRADSFGNDEFLKVWKGLHYCLWMTDKPLIQEELAERMSEFVHCFKNFDTAVSFIKAFFATEVREWSGIDRLRLDKFMMLIRRVLHQSFMLLRRRGWLSSDICRLADVLHITVLDGLNDHIPDGICFHLDDVFIEELDRTASDSQLSAEGTVQLLLPFGHLIAKSSNKALVNHTVKTVFQPLLLRAHTSDDNSVRCVQVDRCLLVEQLTRLAAKRGCKNRACIYRLINRLHEVTEDVNPVQVRQMVVDSRDDNNMEPVVRLAIETGLQSLAAVDSSRQRKRKREIVQVNGSTDEVTDVDKHNGILEHCEESTQRKKSKKTASSEQSNIQLRPEVVTEAARTSESVDAAAAGSESESVLEDEIEIWVPNKKYKGPLRDEYAMLAKKGNRKVQSSGHKDDSMPFMTFIPSAKTPAALVRRRSRLTQSEPKQQLHKSSKKARTALSPNSAGRQKKVKFAMNLNKSQDFEDSLNVTPRQPYNPSLQPDRTILKPSPDTTLLQASKAVKQKSLRTRLRATDFFRDV